MQTGIQIAEARRRKNLTQEQLAELMEVTRQTVSRWEAGASYPEMEKIVRLADILEVSCDDLLRPDASSRDQRVSDGGRVSSKQELRLVTRLLVEAKDKPARLNFFDDEEDMDLCGKTCVITDFDGAWARVEYKSGKKIQCKLVPLSSICALTFEKGGQ